MKPATRPRKRIASVAGPLGARYFSTTDGQEPKMQDVRLLAILDRFGIRCVPCARQRRSGENDARGTLAEILAEHDAGHLDLTLRCIRQSDRNREELTSFTIGGVSDVLAQRPDWCDRPNALLSAMADVDLVGMGEKVRRLRPWPLRETVRALLYYRIEPALGEELWSEAA